MRKLVTLCILLVSYYGIGQTLSSPTSQEVPVGVSGIGVSGFSLSEYNSSTSYKVSLSITGNANATFSVTSTSGLTRDFGFNSWTNITSVNFTGTPQNIENGLNSIKLNTTSTLDGLINLSVVINNQQANTYYNPTNGHMYKFVQGPITWASARNNSLNSTFDGVPGYLVTITSADEQNFVNSKVSAYNIWTGLTDYQNEGYWRWMDGPEAGTVIRIGSTNQSGKYNNWAPGEPNNWGSGEDYMVMKWSGGTQWNDFGPPATTSTAQIGGYLIEYGTWTDPTQSTFSTSQQTQITFTQKNIPYLTYQFNFGNNITPSDWSGIVHYEETQNQYTTTHTTPLSLASNGYVNATPQVFPKGPDGTKKATTVGGSVEWGVLYKYDTTNNRHLLLVDRRELPAGLAAEDVTQLQLFDLWDGEVTYNPTASTNWAYYYIYTDTPIDNSNTNYSSYIRDAGSYFGLKAEFTFVDNVVLKNQSWIFTSKTENEVQQLVDDIVTVSDVVLAFNELAGGGLNGGLKGDLAPIQLALGDMDRNGVFDFQDTYRMLQHLTGANTLLDVNSLAYFMVVREKSVYDGYTSLTWSNGSWTTMMADSKMTESTLVQQLQYNIGFKGDVNMSHSKTTPGISVSAKSFSLNLGRKSENKIQAYIETEEINGELYASVKVDTSNSNLGGLQFKLTYDNNLLELDSTSSKSSGIDFINTKVGTISFGSLKTDGKELIGDIEYTFKFLPKRELEGILGLILIEGIEGVTIDNKELTVTII